MRTPRDCRRVWSSIKVDWSLQRCEPHLCIDFHIGKLCFTVQGCMCIHMFMLRSADTCRSTTIFDVVQPVQRLQGAFTNSVEVAILWKCHRGCRISLEVLQPSQRLQSEKVNPSSKYISQKYMKLPFLPRNPPHWPSSSLGVRYQIFLRILENVWNVQFCEAT